MTLSETKNTVDFKMLFEAVPTPFLILKPDAPHFTILAVSDSYLKATMTERNKIVGKGLFEVFPDNPDDLTADGTQNLRISLASVIKNKEAHTMALQKYDIQRPQSDGGGFEERYWSPLNSPVLNAKNKIEYIVHQVEDVTEFSLFKKHSIEEIQDTRDKLEEKSTLIKVNDERINAILDILLKYTRMDFSKKIPLSENSDELDAIAAGLNTLSEELESHIKQLKESEEQTKASQQLFSKVFYKSPVMNSITDATNGQFIEVNDNFVNFCGFKKEEIIGKSSLDLNLIPKPQHREEIIKNLKEKGFTKDALMEISGRNGEAKWVSTSAHGININGKDCFITAMVDITERKKAEEQLQAVNKELESFSYSVSHDLRAPLRAINGYAGILDEDYGNVLDEEGKRILEAVQYNAKKMGNLIDDLLAFSRLGKKELTKTKLNMNELVEGALYELNKSIKHHATVKIKFLHSAKGDYGLINQVVVNLLSNAIKYSSKVEEPHIEISSEDTGNEIVYSIKDNGAGFDMRYVNKLFGVFQRLHTMDEFEGTGVGLAIVQRILSKHGGKVFAEGEKGKGATFKFSLPVK